MSDVSLVQNLFKPIAYPKCLNTVQVVTTIFGPFCLHSAAGPGTVILW